MPLLSIQEMVAKTEEQRKTIKEQLDRQGRKEGFGFHPEELSIYHGLGRQDYNDLRESIHTVPFPILVNAAAAELGLKQYSAKEFLGVSGTTGISGAAYLIPDKINDIMSLSTRLKDITPLVSRMVAAPGGTTKVDYEVTGQYQPKFYGSGGNMPVETMQFGQATITPKTYGIRLEITQDLIEDAQWDTVQMHLEAGAKAMAEFSSLQIIEILVAAANGDGTLNTVSSTGASGVTDFDDISDAWMANALDGYISDTIITTANTVDDLLNDASITTYSDQWHSKAATDPPMSMGTIMGMQLLVMSPYNTDTRFGTAGLYNGSKYRTLVFAKNDAAATFRKRWLKIENYSNPIADLVGATITAREGYSTVNKDAICLITEQ